MHQSSTDLIERFARTHEHDVKRTLWRHYGAKLSAEDIGDVLQDTYAAASAAIAEPGRPERPRGLRMWFYGAVRHKAIDAIRGVEGRRYTRDRHVSYDVLTEQGTAPEPGDEDEHAESLERVDAPVKAQDVALVDQAFRRLSRQHRELLRMTDMDEDARLAARGRGAHGPEQVRAGPGSARAPSSSSPLISPGSAARLRPGAGADARHRRRRLARLAGCPPSGLPALPGLLRPPRPGAAALRPARHAGPARAVRQHARLGARPRRRAGRGDGGRDRRDRVRARRRRPARNWRGREGGRLRHRRRRRRGVRHGRPAGRRRARRRTRARRPSGGAAPRAAGCRTGVERSRPRGPATGDVAGGAPGGRRPAPRSATRRRARTADAERVLARVLRGVRVPAHARAVGDARSARGRRAPGRPSPRPTAPASPRRSPTGFSEEFTP